VRVWRARSRRSTGGGRRHVFDTGNLANIQELAKGGKVQALTDLVNKLDNELAKVKTQLENTSGTLKDDSKHVEEAKKAVKEVNLVSDSSTAQTDL